MASIEESAPTSEPRRRRVSDVQWKGEAARRARVYLDGEWWMTLEREVIETLSIFPGRELDEQEWRKLELDVAVERAKLFLMRSLSVRAQTRRELMDKLRRREVSEEAAEKALDAVASYGFIDDAEVARAHARSLKEKGYGRGRARLKLREKGVDQEVSDALLEEAFPREDEEDQAYAALRSRRVGREPKEVKRAVDFLLRRGFSYGAASQAVRRRQAEEAEEAEESQGLDGGD